MKELGERLRILRESVKLSQVKMADLLGVKQSSINRYEQGQSAPSLETLAKISQILRVSLDDLVFGEAEISNNMIKILALTLEDKNPEKVKVFLKTVCALADKIDEF